MPQLENTIRRVSAIKGIFLGIVLLAINILSFYLLISATENAWFIVFSPVVFSVVIPIITVLIFCFYLRKSIGGYWVYRQAVTGIFIMFAVCYAIQVVGRDAIFAKLIEPDMVNKTQTAMMKATTAMLKKSGANQAAIDQKKAEIQKQLDGQKNITVGAIIQGYVITIIFLFAFALIFALLFRRNPPGYSASLDAIQ